MTNRRRAVGAEPVPGGVHFRVWAPGRKSLSVVTGGAVHALERERDGYFSGLIEDAAAGTRYRFLVDDDATPYPDPASRFQPDGPHGDSVVVDAAAHTWGDRDWRGIGRHGRVVYEMHIGTFTTEGTWAAATPHIARLAALGINVIEMMPVNEFAGRFGWGYDGVDLWAPAHVYGEPDDLRRFIDEAHRHGVGVILDIVYNHLGPDGCYLKKFSDDYFTKKYENEWGEAINFDGRQSRGVREFFCENAAYWIAEFHFDGFRIDATQSFFDASEEHILAAIVNAAWDAARSRSIWIAGENEPQDVKLLNHYGLDALWNDDWHHSTSVAATGRNEAYYTDYLGKPQELVSMARLGFLYQGQHYRWQKKRRGTCSVGIAPERLVLYLQNHDQVANSARGLRLHQLTTPGRWRALTALLLLLPQTPMLFQGDEFAASSPFLYFADHGPELASLVATGRGDFLSQFPSIDRSALAQPHDPATFERCKLSDVERERNVEATALHRDLLELRRTDPVFSAQRNDSLHGSVSADEAFVLRWYNAGDDRLLIVNLGRDLNLDPAPDPLLAPPDGKSWELLWSSESSQYGGGGTSSLEVDGEGWRIPGHATLVMISR